MKPRIVRYLSVICVLASTAGWLGAQAPTPPVAREGRAPAAQTLIDAALARAKAEQKIVFVDFGASWCGPCRVLHKFIEDPATHPVIDKYFIVVSLVVLEYGPNIPLMNPGAEELMRAWGNTGGIPFWRFLDSSGKLLPARPWSQDAGLAVMAPGMTEKERAILANYFSASEANAELGIAGRADRWLWTVPSNANNLVGGVSPDGRFVAFMDYLVSYGDLFLQDLKTRSQRRLTTTALKDDHPNWTSAFSRDGSRLAYGWQTGARTTLRHHLRVMNLEGPANERKLLEQAGLAGVSPRDWAPDGESVLADITRPDGSRHLARLFVQNGDLRVLRSLAAAGTRSAFFSPDGQYIAFDERARGSDTRDIIVLAVDSGREFPAVVHSADDLLIGWSREGDRLVFASDRSGSRGIWIVPFHAGQTGTPDLLKRDGGEGPISLAADGALYHWISPGTISGASNVRILSIDFSSGQVTRVPEGVQEFPGASPHWSHDGKLLAYRTTRAGIGGREQRGLAIRSMSTGTVREFWSSPEVASVVGWAADDRAILVTVRTMPGLFKVDASTGEVAAIARAGGFRQVSADGSRLYVDRFDGDGIGAVMSNAKIAIVEYDTASGVEREIFRGPAQDARRLSPDGRTIYRQPLRGGEPPFDLVARDLRSGGEQVLVSGQARGPLRASSDGRYLLSGTYLLVNTAGGPVRDLRFSEADSFVDVVSAPDGRSVLVNGRLANEGPGGTWWVPLDGRPPRRIGDFLELSGAVIHPDGRRIAVAEPPPSRTPPDELWVLENLVRPARVKRQQRP